MSDYSQLTKAVRGHLTQHTQVADLQRQLDETRHEFYRRNRLAHDLVQALERQLAEVTRERDTLKAMVDLHDALNDRRRAQANETTFKRRTYENG